MTISHDFAIVPQPLLLAGGEKMFTIDLEGLGFLVRQLQRVTQLAIHDRNAVLHYLLTCSLLPVKSSPKETNDVFFVLDTSASMSAPLDGAPDILEGVKKAIIHCLQEKAVDTDRVGYVAFSEGRQRVLSECRELSPVRRKLLIDEIDNLQASGCTSFEEAITRTMGLIELAKLSLERPIHIVLVSDGQSNSDADETELLLGFADWVRCDNWLQLTILDVGAQGRSKIFSLMQERGEGKIRHCSVDSYARLLNCMESYVFNARDCFVRDVRFDFSSDDVDVDGDTEIIDAVFFAPHGVCRADKQNNFFNSDERCKLKSLELLITFGVKFSPEEMSGKIEKKIATCMISYELVVYGEVKRVDGKFCLTAKASTDQDEVCPVNNYVLSKLLEVRADCVNAKK